jgi:FkbM family methyltransferase
MIRSGIRGGYRLIDFAERWGRLDVIARYQLGDVSFHAPLYRKDNRWDNWDVSNYEQAPVELFCNVLAGWPEVTLLDCGADIGIISSLVVARSPGVKQVLAFEPNGEVRDLLRMNLAALKIPATAFTKAVSSHNGKGTLKRPPYDASDHARYLVPGEDGEVETLTIDSLGIFEPNLAIKIDVEGGEIDALKGAEQTIRQARNCVILLEANPRVARRLSHDPCETLRYLSTIRKFSFLVAETKQRLDTEHRVLLANQEAVMNIIASTEAD